MARLSEKSLLAIAAVVDVALHARGQPVAAKALAERHGVTDKVRLLGAIDDEALLGLYAEALAVAYVPFDEDFGYVTLEGFLSRRPGVTARDSGGPLEFVVDGVNGAAVEPTAEAVATAINRYAADRRLAASHGAAGFERAKAVTWDGVIEKLVGE